MKNTNYKSLAMSLLFVLVSLVSASSLFAQAQPPMQVNVPFEFSVGNRNFPAGDYSVSRIRDEAFLIRSADGKTSVIAAVSAANRVVRPTKMEKLVFNRYSDRYFLRQIYSSRNAYGFALRESGAEKSFRLEIAANKNSKPEEVAVNRNR